ncbi:acyl carrier protein [Burkholderia sp. Ac-20379]|uniref:acyl carrier protein n=1 Tax=Burkholderia sp. Ac-20379 TaxID=2703900 RepID=UPI00197DC555|nr:acyl carrier protein [Burkholderia sp. Ac-20379]MBN3723236.1 acyl carrier protein [Burkholderia sp. Ac-20379]
MEQETHVFDVVVEIITEIVAIEVAPEMITPAMSLTADLMLDSISLLSLIALAEERLAISFSGSTSRVAELDTVGDAVALASELVQAQAQAEAS